MVIETDNKSIDLYRINEVLKMLNKMNEVINNTINKITWEEESIKKYSNNIKQSIESYNEYEMIEFIPSMLNTLKESMERKKALQEQLKMLKYIQIEN